MRVKHLAQKNKMTKGKTANAATSWVPSVFTQKDLNKARADGLVSDENQVIFPSTKRIPKPRDGFWVIFSPFFCVVFPFLPTSSFVGFLSFMVCSFISSHQIPSCILLAS
jgi:hypothetical protein